ncbi:transposase [Thermoanaerobacterium thermosaccharolyticum]|uniref:Transposase n=1 Tax=Thermoanaerobacterium thermosaccharolyticum TaxID=1517 RepID=A0A223I1B8_THETR|nr:IS66 family insertion sequence element accessory protein TnpB [Thermoanaerobacterium thermosaccharolyticum]AST58295.1 transposase [Thermoanaerobacterium thermosaccharolyticum]
MRKSIDSLAAIVQQSFELDPFSSALFVFCNKSRDKRKGAKMVTGWIIAGAEKCS